MAIATAVELLCRFWPALQTLLHAIINRDLFTRGPWYILAVALPLSVWPHVRRWMGMATASAVAVYGGARGTPPLIDGRLARKTDPPASRYNPADAGGRKYPPPDNTPPASYAVAPEPGPITPDAQTPDPSPPREIDTEQSDIIRDRRPQEALNGLYYAPPAPDPNTDWPSEAASSDGYNSVPILRVWQALTVEYSTPITSKPLADHTVRLLKRTPPEGQAILKKAHPELNLTFTNTSNSKHAVAANMRALVRHTLACQIGHGLRIANVGGNVNAWVSMGMGDGMVFLSPPHLEERDPQRHRALKRTLVELNSVGVTPEVKELTLEQLNEKVDVVISVHSAYNTPLAEIMRASYRCGAQVVYVAYFMTPDLLLQDQGMLLSAECRFERRWDRRLRRPVIEFTQVGESGETYVHDMDNIVDLAATSGVNVDRGRHYTGTVLTSEDDMVVMQYTLSHGYAEPMRRMYVNEAAAQVMWMATSVPHSISGGGYFECDITLAVVPRDILVHALAAAGRTKDPHPTDVAANVRNLKSSWDHRDPNGPMLGWATKAELDANFGAVIITVGGLLKAADWTGDLQRFTTGRLDPWWKTLQLAFSPAEVTRRNSQDALRHVLGNMHQRVTVEGSILDAYPHENTLLQPTEPLERRPATAPSAPSSSGPDSAEPSPDTGVMETKESEPCGTVEQSVRSGPDGPVLNETLIVTDYWHAETPLIRQQPLTYGTDENGAESMLVNHTTAEDTMEAETHPSESARHTEPHWTVQWLTSVTNAIRRTWWTFNGLPPAVLEEQMTEALGKTRQRGARDAATPPSRPMRSPGDPTRWEGTIPHASEPPVTRGLGGRTIYNSSDVLPDAQCNGGVAHALGISVPTQNNCLLEAVYQSPERYEKDLRNSGQSRVDYYAGTLRTRKAVVTARPFWMATADLHTTSEDDSILLALESGRVNRIVPQSWGTSLSTALSKSDLQPIQSQDLVMLCLMSHLEAKPATSPHCFWHAVSPTGPTQLQQQLGMCPSLDVALYCHCNNIALIHERTLYTNSEQPLASIRQFLLVDGRHVYTVNTAKARALVGSLSLRSVTQWTLPLNGDVSDDCLALDRLLREAEVTAAKLAALTVGDSRKCAVMELLAYENKVYIVILQRLLLAMELTKPEDLRATRMVQIYSLADAKFVSSPPTEVQSHCWTGSEFAPVTYNSHSRTYHCTRASGAYLYFSDEISFMRERQLLERALPLLPQLASHNWSKLHVELRHGAPGCGKTTSVLNDHTRGVDLVVTASKAGQMEYQELTDARYHQCYRTIDSAMLHGVRRSNRVFADEATMVHFGALLLVAWMADARHLVCFGDRDQIQFIARTPGMTVSHSEIQADKVVKIVRTHRMPQCMMPIMSQVYPGITTSNKREGSIVINHIAGGQSVPSDVSVVLTFTQSEKADMQQITSVPVMTVHEAEGKTFDHVAVVRLLRQDNIIFESRPHIIVAISRHRDRLLYCTVNPRDKLSAILRQVTTIQPADTLRVREGVQEVVRVHTCEPPSMAQLQYTAAERDPERLQHIWHYIHSRTNCNTNIAPTPTRTLWLSRSLPKGHAPANIPISTAQDILHSIFDPTDYDAQYALLHNDMIAHEDHIKINPAVYMAARPSTTDYLTRVLDTPQPARHSGSGTEVLFSIAKRNAPTPSQTGTRDPDLADLTAQRFMEVFVDPAALPTALSNSSSHMAAFVKEFFSTRDPAQLAQLAAAQAVEANPNRYSSAVRPDHKPPLNNTQNVSLVAGQVVTAHAAMTTVRFTAEARAAQCVLLECLQPKWMIDTGVTAASRDGHINAILMRHSTMKMLESDFSKFDKSQEEVILAATCKILAKLGMSLEAAQEWYDCHRNNTLVFHKLGIQVLTEYQRRSGDVLTFLGNTIVTMMTLAFVYNLAEAYGGIFGGDDSLIFLPPTALIPDQAPQLAALFNLTAKIENFAEAPYFASRFLVYANGRYAFVPDPIKMLTRLGRRDLYCIEHIDHYLISYSDNMGCYLNSDVRHQVSHMARIRYAHLSDHMATDLGPLVDFLGSLVNNKSKMRTLFTGTARQLNRRLPAAIRANMDRRKAFKDPILTWDDAEL
ncbi:polyprotein [Brown algae RNA virus 1]|nr:polyprotein [Brown algae RNA virus 1]